MCNVHYVPILSKHSFFHLFLRSCMGSVCSWVACVQLSEPSGRTIYDIIVLSSNSSPSEKHFYNRKKIYLTCTY